MMAPESTESGKGSAIRARATDAKPASRYLMTERGYLHPMKTYIWITLLILGVMSVLYYVMGLGSGAQGSLPPKLSFGVSDLYFHSIAIAMAALGVYFVFLVFDLDKYEPAIDFPIPYRALAASVFGAAGAFLYLRPVFQSWFAPIPLGLILLGLILLADVGGALLIQLYLLPGKLAGTYDPSQNLMGMIPKWKHLPSWRDFRKMDSTYWLTFVAVICTFIAGVIGFVAFWLNYFVIDIGQSPGIFNGYIAWMGGASAMLGYNVGAHSHLIVMTLLLGIAAIVAKRFDVLGLVGWKRGMAKVGLWVGVSGTLVMTAVFILEAFTTVFPGGAPDKLFAFDAGGPLHLYSATASNGLAGDDFTMLWASLGAMIILIPLLFTQVRGRPAWKDPVRMGILGTWVLTFIATPIQGFYIELNPSITPFVSRNDIVFGALQYFALIGLPLLCMGLLAIDFYNDRSGVRTPLAAFAILSGLFATVTGYLYAFFSAGPYSWGFWAFNIGFILMDLFLLAAMVGVLMGRTEKIPSEEIPPAVPATERALPPRVEPEKVPA